MLSPSLLRRLKGPDPKMQDKLWIYLTARDKHMAVDTSMTHGELWQMAKLRMRAVGCRSESLVIAGDGTVDWSKCKPWILERMSSGRAQVKHRFLELDPVLLSEADSNEPFEEKEAFDEQECFLDYGQGKTRRLAALFANKLDYAHVEHSKIKGYPRSRLQHPLQLSRMGPRASSRSLAITSPRVTSSRY